MKREKAEKLRALIEKASAGLEDAEALEGVELFPAWKPETDYPAGRRLQHEGRLWRTRQAVRSLDIYPPGAQGTEALYEEVAAPGEGETKDNPIAYNRNMALELGKFYVDVPAGDGVVYVCTRDSGIALVHPLAQLVGHYVEEAA